MSRPDYIIIGAMKCGTSTLAAQLGAQAGCFMTDPKEPQYFSDDPVYANGSEWYAELFAGAGQGDLKGEASTHYTKLPTYPQTVSRMKAALPELRFVYMIRNPMMRAVSHYIHAWSEGELSCTIDEALRTMPELVDYGRYAMQIAPFIEAYGQESILLTSLEKLKMDRDRELARIAAHIGLAEPVAWVEESERENVSSERVRRLPLQELLVDNPIATTIRQNLVPKSLRTWVRNQRKMKNRPEIPIDQIPRLERVFLEDQNRLAAFFPDDASLQLAYPFRRMTN